MNFEKIINFINNNYHHRRIVKFLNRNKISKIIDVGSHKGEFLQCFLKLKKIKTVYAFEPQIEIFNILNENLKKYKNINKYNIALDFKNGNKKIYINKLTSTSTMKIINKNSFFSKIKKILLQYNDNLLKNYLVKTNSIDFFLKT